MTRLNLLLPNQATAARSRHTGPNGRLHCCAPRILGAFLSVLIMLALKRYYSLATADQLDWILTPTARLVAWFTSAHPVYESGVGYVDFARGIIIAPACAGINFMIMAFGLAVLCSLVQLERFGPILGWMTMVLLGAYGYTIMINALRIGISMALYSADIYGQWLTVMRLHRLWGIGLYLGALWLLFIGLQPVIHHFANRFDRNIPRMRRRLPGWLPLGWYVVGTVGVPYLGLLFQGHGPAFGEHCATILAIATCLGGAAKLTGLLGGSKQTRGE